MRFKPTHTLMILASLLLVLAALTVGHSQIGAQEKQRPRRVNGSQQQTPTPPKTVNPGDEVDEGDVVRVDTQLVSVPAMVTDTGGHPISNLRQDNFQLFEDGKPQTITNFGTAQAPFEIALLLDTSGSTSNDVALIREAAKSFIES